MKNYQDLYLAQADNLQPGPQDDRDYWFENPGKLEPKTFNLANLPKKVDLLPWLDRIENQGSLGSCTANAATSALECLMSQRGRRVQQSRLFVYYNARARRDPNNIQDAGSNIHLAHAELTKKGSTSEDNWPYVEANVNTKPSDDAYTEALNHLVTRYERVSPATFVRNAQIHIDAILVAIASGIPVTFGIGISNDFFSLSGKLDTHLAKYDPTERLTRKTGLAGYHAMCIVGYDLNARYFIVENSWGPEWGDGGFCAMSFDNFLANAFEGIVIREFDGLKTSILPELVPPPPVVQPPKKKKKPWWKFW